MNAADPRMPIASPLTLPDGMQLALSDDGGPGEPVLFVHGALTDLRMWDEHRALLAARRGATGVRTLVFTQRYHHGSPVSPA